MSFQVSLVSPDSGFGSVSADICQTESLRILAERLSQWEVEPRWDELVITRRLRSGVFSH